MNYVNRKPKISFASLKTVVCSKDSLRISKLESSYETNKKKGKRADDDDFDYLYGIVTLARGWHFLLYFLGEVPTGE